MPQIEGERVIADLKRFAEFGRYKSGVHRPTYSPEDVASRHWLAEQFAAAGLDPVIDGIGNVIGRNPRATRRPLVYRWPQRRRDRYGREPRGAKAAAGPCRGRSRRTAVRAARTVALCRL